MSCSFPQFVLAVTISLSKFHFLSFNLCHRGLRRGKVYDTIILMTLHRSYVLVNELADFLGVQAELKFGILTSVLCFYNGSRHYYRY